MVRAASTVRLAMPVSTPPGPSSTNSVTPVVSSVEQAVLPAHRAAELRRQQARPTRRRCCAASASTLDTTGTSVSRGFASAIALRSRSRAGVMNGVWKAPDTGSGITFLAPSSLATMPAATTPSGEPAMTTWPGALKLATHTSLSARRQATSTWSSSRPSTAAIVPGFSMPASCIASARSLTRRTPSSKPERAGGGQRGVLAEAVAGAEARFEAEPLDGVEHHQARHERGELRVAGVLQLLGVGVEQQPADVALGDLRCLVDELPALVIDPGSAHAGSL